ncbi:dermonecrotic toxin domain-containing protein [Pseudomonas sp. NPDC087346]|uniref:dermonecrotic toxin domain-containing protein n=1 Tax=Pseudomonas sp. NPDC087346 TaxID=3364438 RepID=UPI0038078D09
MPETTRTDIAPPLLNKSRLVEQSSGGPTLHDAAAQLLRKALNQRFPQQSLDPDKTMLMSPVWHRQGDDLVSHGNQFESLTHVLARLAFTRVTANYIEGEHFLTLTPRASEPVHLPISMDAVTTILNDHAPALFVGFAQSQLDYWNAAVDTVPRWQQLSDTLQQSLHVQSVDGWDANECALARHVSQFPDKALRAATHAGLVNIRASLIDIDVVFDLAESSQTRHLMLTGALVLTATLGSRELITLYTIDEGCESFGSMAQLGATLPGRIDLDLRGQGLKWRLYEPEGNIFDAMVWALVGCQVDSIDALDPASRSPAKGLAIRQDSNASDTQITAHIEQLESAIPEWLMKGSLEDIQAYSGYLTALGKLRGESASDVFDSSPVPLIMDYAQQQMRAAIIAERTGADATLLRLDDVRITVTQSFEVGGFTLPDPRQVRVQSLGEFALHNTSPYLAKVAYVDGALTPDWMTSKFLLRIASEINIGENYPKLIKSTLIDDPQQARRHKLRYSRQLPMLLPVLALECKLKQQGDVDEQGYRQVCQLMTSITAHTPAAEWQAQIRPLAFIPHFRRGSTPDTIANMYIISPREGASGPCLLYRPLLDQPLRQFPSEQNMLYAFYQPGELRDSVLAWLPTRALSFEYAQYVFSSGLPSPWVIADLAFDPFRHLDLSAAVSLAKAHLSGDICSTLFDNNSLAMVELADRQSTSNAERRWALLADSGWALFGVATNFLSGPAGAAVWVWQTINQIQQALDAHAAGDTSGEWSSIGDVLLTLGILLAQRTAVRRLRLSSPLIEEAVFKRALADEPRLVTQPQRKAPVTIHDTMSLTDPLSDTHSSTLAPVTLIRINAHAAFLQTIERLKVPRPNLPEGAIANTDHLYEFAGKQYAKVGERWFQVSAEPDEPVFVLDPNAATHPGLCVKFDAQSRHWHWELKLRLRGGGPTGRIETLRREKIKRKDEAWAALHRFMEQEATNKADLDEALRLPEHNDLSAAMSEEDIATYISKSDTLASGYSQALLDLEKWREAGGAGVFYQAQLMRLTIEQNRYLNGWMRMKLREYARIVAPQLSALEPAETRARPIQMEAARKAIAVSDEMIERLTLLHTSQERLNHHTGTTRKVAAELQRLMPALSRHDLQANEIGMSIELSLRDAPDSTLEPLRQLIIPVFDGAADAGHTLFSRAGITRAVKNPNLSIEQLIVLVDRLADAEHRLQDLFTSSSTQLETSRFQRVQQLVAEFHQQARHRLLELLPEPEEIPTAAMARLEPTPSTSRAVGKVNKSRPRIIETQKAASTETSPALEEMPIVKSTARRPIPAPTPGDEALIGNAMTMVNELDPIIKRLRTDAQRPSRIPADMKDLFDQQATRLDHAAANVDAVLARRHAEFPVASLSSELRNAAIRMRREGVNVYGAMLTGRKPRESYLQWLHDHDLVQINKDPRGRIRTKQRKDYFQEYRVFDKARQNKPLWVAHFHYDALTDPDDQFTAAHLKFADNFLQELPAKTRQELESFDAVDNVLRRIVHPKVLDLFLHPDEKVD